MYCKKCGTEQKDGQKFCPECGAEFISEHSNVNENLSMNDGKLTCQTEEQQGEKSIISAKGKQKKGRSWIIIALLFLILSLAVAGFYFFKPLKDANGFELLTLNEVELPNGTNGIIVAAFFNGEENILKIYKDGKLLQELETGVYDQRTDELVHLLDYNYDGYIDIVFGQPIMRAYKKIFLWDENLEKFASYRGSAFSYPLFCKSDKTLYVYYGDVYEQCYEKYMFDGGILKEEKTLTIYIDPSFLKDEHPSLILDDSSINLEDNEFKYYTITDSNNNIIAKGSQLSDLPEAELWDRVMKKEEISYK